MCDAVVCIASAALHGALATQGCTPHLGHYVRDVVDAQVPRAVRRLEEVLERLVACAAARRCSKLMPVIAFVPLG